MKEYFSKMNQLKDTVRLLSATYGELVSWTMENVLIQIWCPFSLDTNWTNMKFHPKLIFLDIFSVGELMPQISKSRTLSFFLLEIKIVWNNQAPQANFGAFFVKHKCQKHWINGINKFFFVIWAQFVQPRENKTTKYMEICAAGEKN